MSWKLKGRCTPAASLAVVVHEPLERQVDLADEHALAVSSVGDPAHLRGDGVDLGLVGRMELQHAVHLAHARAIGGIRRVVAEGLSP